MQESEEKEGTMMWSRGLFAHQSETETKRVMCRSCRQNMYRLNKKI